MAQQEAYVLLEVIVPKERKLLSLAQWVPTGNQKEPDLQKIAKPVILGKYEISFFYPL